MPPAPKNYARQLELFDVLRRDLIAQALAWLDLPQGGLGLDAGCGAGLHLESLLKAVSPGGRVCGADLSPELLERARALAALKNLADMVDLKRADIHHLPFGDAGFDWLWSVDCAGYMPGDKAALLRELARVLKPGGRLALMAYSSQQLLPGHPGLEARLNATGAGQLPFQAQDAARDHFLRLGERLSQAGLQEIKVKSFLAEFSAPLEPMVMDALLELMDMRWGAARTEISVSDWDLFSRLSQPDSAECVLRLPGYHGFFTYTMFTARKPH